MATFFPENGIRIGSDVKLLTIIIFRKQQKQPSLVIQS